MEFKEQHVDAYMVTWKLEREFGGMTTVCTQRAAAFAERHGSAAVITFAANAQIPQIADELVERGKLSPEVQVLNPYLYLAKHNLKPQERIPGRTAEPAHQDFTVSESVHHPGGAGVFCEHSVAGPEGEARQTSYFRGDGTVFLTDTKFHDGKHRRVVEAFDRTGTLVARFNSAASFYRHWLSQIVDHPNALVVIDSKFTAAMLASWKPVHVPKVFAFHSIHVAKGQDLSTGILSTGHAPIIEERANWDAFVFLTRAQRQAYVERFGNPDSAFVIPNPLKHSVVEPPEPTRSAADLIVAGSLTPNKNVSAALDVVHELSRRGKHPTLHIVGKGSERDALEARAAELGLGEQAVFHGFSDQLPRRFASCLAQLFTSTNEGQALVILEAQAQGCIPVSFDISFGPADSITDGSNGFLVPHGDIQLMADRVEQLMDDPALAARMSQQARTFASEYQSRDLVSLWEETVSIAKLLKKKAAKNDVPHFEARLRGVEFPEGQGLQVKVEHHADLSALPADAIFELVFVNRGSKDELAAVPSSSMVGELALFDLDPQLLGKIPHQDAVVDVNLRLRVGTVAQIKRLGRPESAILPYFTTQKNLSFRPEQ